jgi:hypothetical protein
MSSESITAAMVVFRLHALIRRLLPATLIVWVGVATVSPGLGQDVGESTVDLSRFPGGRVTGLRGTGHNQGRSPYRAPDHRWSSARSDLQPVPAISDFVQQEPNEGEPATEITELWVFFDDTSLYVSARCPTVSRAARSPTNCAATATASIGTTMSTSSSTRSTIVEAGLLFRRMRWAPLATRK